VFPCVCTATSALEPDEAPVSDARTLTLRCESASHSLPLPLVALVSARATFPRGPSAICSARSRARRSSHRALSASARSRTSALCRRHSVTCTSYSVFQVSGSVADTETEGEDEELGCSVPEGTVGGATGSEGECEGETRVRLGGTEKGSERAACGGRVGFTNELIWLLGTHLEEVVSFLAQRTCVVV
jgi:hypothetical protein